MIVVVAMPSRGKLKLNCAGSRADLNGAEMIAEPLATFMTPAVSVASAAIVAG
jgi:hypothetical protein